MTHKIIYGTDTQSIEDYYQSVVLLLPDEVNDLEDIEEYLQEHHWADVPQQTIVTWEDIVESLTLILSVSDVAPEEQKNILLDLFDAVSNNDN